MDGDDELEAILADRTTRPFVDRIPKDLSAWMLGVEWDRDRLWAIDQTRIDLPIDELSWHYGLPWWTGSDGRPFRLRPEDFMADPTAYPDHASRTFGADLRHPIHVIHRKGRWLILDGIHRLAKAGLAGIGSMAAVHVSAADLVSLLDVPGPEEVADPEE